MTEATDKNAVINCCSLPSSLALGHATVRQIIMISSVNAITAAEEAGPLV